MLTKYRKWIKGYSGFNDSTAFVAGPVMWRAIEPHDAELLLPMQEWIDGVNCGAFTDDDGYGFYAEQNAISDAIVVPSDVWLDRLDTDIPFICWYNK